MVVVAAAEVVAALPMAARAVGVFGRWGMVARRDMVLGVQPDTGNQRKEKSNELHLLAPTVEDGHVSTGWMVRPAHAVEEDRGRSLRAPPALPACLQALDGLRAGMRWNRGHGCDPIADCARSEKGNHHAG